MMDEATLRLTIGLVILAAALIAVSIGLIMTEAAAARDASADATQPGGRR